MGQVERGHEVLSAELRRQPVAVCAAAPFVAACGGCGVVRGPARRDLVLSPMGPRGSGAVWIRWFPHSQASVQTATVAYRENTRAD